ncbi:Pectate lyase/Amb allergen [Corchorus capsularis]|uniref:Pectate lyase n=1 Tax=Corchorus capsularis TaxID=210143 RepID=A0A1R3I9G8_COCAP|nr:Pectate lyase/Amb allergen [Corchorus capsularis]
MEVNKLRLVFFFSFVTLIPTLLAGIGNFDDYWKKREQEAWKKTLAAYNPNPENVTSSTNHNVHKALVSHKNETRAYNKAHHAKTNNSTTPRRNMMGKHKKYSGPCLATNPIDRCWRCKPDWAKNRKKLANCALGFGHQTQGGKRGRFYIVTDNSDNDMLNPKPGTLRHAVIQKEPLWIVFAHDMHIKLNQELLITSKKTIDGRGANVHIAYGAGITIQFVEDVILHGLHIHNIIPRSGGLIRDSVDHYGFRTQSDGDGISIFGSSNIWLDHISMHECSDGLIDAIQGSTAITISNCHFTHHNDVILLGASDSYSKDKLMQVTVAFNHFGKELIQRMPRCRWGFFHVVNNDYTHWKMYAIGGSQHPTIISQGNRYIAPDDPKAKEITNRNYGTEAEYSTWVWRSEGDMFLNGAHFRTSGPDAPPKYNYNKLQMIKAKPATFVRRLTRFAGALDCKKGVKC